jgi:tetratricopeptide (TPR) repeat protein
VRTKRIDEIDPIAVVGGELQWRPVRRTLGIEAFGINAYTADAGEFVVEEHDETGTGAGHHEELYIVVTGRATFTVDGESFDAPVGGGARGEPFRVSPWEFAFAGTPAYKAKRYDEAEALLREGLELCPENASLLYDLACLDALQGRSGEALEHLRTAVEAQPKFKEYAAKDDDLASIRADPRFPK